MPPRKSHAKPKEDADGLPLPKRKCALEIQWAKDHNWTYTLIAYLTDHVEFCIKMFSDSTADATKDGRQKHTAKDGKAQQYFRKTPVWLVDQPLLVHTWHIYQSICRFG